MHKEIRVKMNEHYDLDGQFLCCIYSKLDECIL